MAIKNAFWTMEGSGLELRGLAAVDREIDAHPFTPAEYAIVRRIIGETGDLEYLSLLAFSSGSLTSGAVALKSHAPVITDVPLVHLAVQPMLQATFLNALHCAGQIMVGHNDRVAGTTGMLRLARTYPESIFVIGQAIAPLSALVEMIEAEDIQPALVIATPSGILDADVVKGRLQDARIPNICIRGRKGGALIAAVIFTELVRLAWVAHQAYEPPAAE